MHGQESYPDSWYCYFDADDIELNVSRMTISDTSSQAEIRSLRGKRLSMMERDVLYNRSARK